MRLFLSRRQLRKQKDTCLSAARANCLRNVRQQFVTSVSLFSQNRHASHSLPPPTQTGRWTSRWHSPTHYPPRCCQCRDSCLSLGLVNTNCARRQTSDCAWPKTDSVALQKAFSNSSICPDLRRPELNIAHSIGNNTSTS